ncbi:galactofuranose ABC transporter, permease protein YjfF [Rhizosaccharibacter radicis]|uniref:Sugar ABC transporter permease YjfF n=1 Tax=Rhizosaccharibacter radicis TaxID=2782605 RepID=A0ABT1W093_9PROT|nr:sugar ABC transporter permease YjfF [Acetobacteraceae bacterium KSS12]
MNSRLPVIVTTIVFLLGFAGCGLHFPHFASTRVVGNLLTDNAYLGVMAVGMTFVIISGGIDLSVGAVLGFTTVFLAIAIGRLGIPPLLAFVLVLLLAGAFGAAMGALIQFLEMPPFIVTLAGMFLARGASFLLSTQSIPVGAPLYDTLNAFALHLPGGGRLTFITLLMLAVFAGGIVLLHFTRFGSYVYALGGSRASTALMGIPVARTTIRIYALSGLLAGLSGIVFSLYTSSGYSLSGVGNELDAIAAVVIGGTLLSGGVGTLFGTFVGVLIEGLIQTYITFDGTLSSWWAKIVTGALLFAFIAFQRLMSGGGFRRSRAGAAAA